MIGPGGLLLVVSTCDSFIGGVTKNKTAKLRHVILLSKVTYWAPPVEML
jgi:hypothetical protein